MPRRVSSSPTTGSGPTSIPPTASPDGSDTTVESSPEEPRYVDGDADELFTQDQLNTIELTLDPDQLAFLDGDPTAEEFVEGSLTFDGETIDGVGIRYKGSVGSWIGCQLTGVDVSIATQANDSGSKSSHA